MEISTVIVTYNSANEIKKCIDSLLNASRGLLQHIIIIDNASRDNTVAIIEKCVLDSYQKKITIELIKNQQNKGFTKAVNQGLAKVKGDFILLLNPDTELQTNTLSALMNYLNDHPEIAVIAPQLVFPDGSVQPSCRRFPLHQDVLFEIFGLGILFPRHRIFNRWKMGDFDHSQTREVDQPQGAYLLVRTEAFNQVGVLDPKFRMFFSDVDWCQRYKKCGWKIVFYPKVKVIHHQGTSVYNNRARMIVTSHRDFYHYFCKYYQRRIYYLPNHSIGFLLLVLLIPRLLVSQISKY